MKASSKCVDHQLAGGGLQIGPLQSLGEQATAAGIDLATDRGRG
jgi:hypothetical protein